MAIDAIDWSRLASFDTDRRRSFEELCYQLVARELAPAALTRLDGSGGDGGVEFYRTMPGGDEHGWQVKFFWPDRRLRGPRRSQIRRSLQRACAAHPRLVAWTLVTPGNLTGAERAWFDGELRGDRHDGARVVPARRAIALAHLGESELVARLAAPAAEGLRAYFFGGLELSQAWFQKLADESIAALGRKFLPPLHATTAVDRALDVVLAEPVFGEALNELVRELWRALIEVRDMRRSLRDISGIGKPAAAAVKASRDACAVVLAALRVAHERADAAAREFAAGRWRGARTASPIADPAPVAAFLAAWAAVERLPRDRIRAWQLDMPNSISWESYTALRRRWAENALTCLQKIENQLGALGLSEVHVFGAAGHGKSHLAAHQVAARLTAGRPAVLLLGARFTSTAPIEQQILALLHLGHVAWDDFLGALAACAQAHGARIPIVIDGLNEAVSDAADAVSGAGAGLSPVWKHHLAAFTAGIRLRTDAVVVITTCRGSYRQAIWGDAPPPARIELDADTGYDVHEAIAAYFAAYKIVADPTAAPVEQFEHPIYLRLFCEAYNPERAVPREVVLGEQTLFQVFARFLEGCDARARAALRRMRGVQLVEPALIRLARVLWAEARRGCPVARAAELLDRKPLDEIDAARSLTRFLEQEDVLLVRDWGTDGEELGFAYDLMAGYCIARALIADHAAGAGLGDPALADRLFGSELAERHPLAEDIARALAVLCPGSLGCRLDELIEHDGARRSALVALFEGEVALVRAADRELVMRWFADRERREWLIERLDSVAVDPAHPLGAELLSDLLAGLDLAERDLVWSEHVREHIDDCLRRAEALEEAARAWITGTTTLVSAPRLRVLAIYARWLLACSTAELRDAATRALYWYGRVEPAALLGLALEALAGDDASIADRVLAALYGVVMARAWERGRDGFAGPLAAIARAIFDAVFARGAPHPVRHEAARDYAHHLVQRALVEQPALLTRAERRRIAAPFPVAHKAEWPVIAEDPGSEEDPDNHSPLHPDFANFTLGALVPGRKVSSFRHPGYRKVRGQVLWRIGELGYTWQRFAEADRDTAESGVLGQPRGAHLARRYGQKYAWIAYEELVALRADSGPARDHRRRERGIEPSFPANVQVARPAFVPALIAPRLDSPAAGARDGGAPDLASLLERRDVIGDAACVLLHGELRELEAEIHADAWLRAFVVPALATDLLRAAAERPIGYGQLEFDYTTYAGEYPWAPGLPVGVRDELVFSPWPGGRLASVRALPAIHLSSWTLDDDDATHRRFANLAPEIARALALHARPEAWELFDRDGRQVTRNLAFGDPSLACTLMYVRRAALARYLAANDAVLVVLAHGHRHGGRRRGRARPEIFHRAWVIEP